MTLKLEAQKKQKTHFNDHFTPFFSVPTAFLVKLIPAGAIRQKSNPCPMKPPTVFDLRRADN